MIVLHSILHVSLHSYQIVVKPSITLQPKRLLNSEKDG
jgi:hypothetical protein